jgi:hypothetical protein
MLDWLHKIVMPMAAAVIGGLMTAAILKPAEIDYQTLVAKEIESFELLADSLVEAAHPEHPAVMQPSVERSRWLADRLNHKARIMLAMYGYPRQLLAFEDYLISRSREQPGWSSWPTCAPSQSIDKDVRIYSLWREQLFRGTSPVLRLLGEPDSFADAVEEKRVLALLIHNCVLERSGDAAAGG